MTKFLGVLEIPVYKHSYQAGITGTPQVFNQGSASTPTMALINFDGQANYNATPTYSARGIVTQLFPWLPPLNNYQLDKFGSQTANADIGTIGFSGIAVIWNKFFAWTWPRNGQLPTAPVVACTPLMGRTVANPIPVNWGPVATETNWFNDSPGGGGGNSECLYEACYYGLPYAVIPCQNRANATWVWEMKMFNLSLYPNAAPYDPITGNNNVGSPVIPVDVALSNANDWTVLNTTTEYFQSNVPDYKNNWNYALLTGPFASITSVRIVQWQLTGSATPLRIKQIVNFTFDTPSIPGAPALPISKLSYTKFQATAFGHIGAFSSAYTINGHDYWQVLILPNGSGYYLLDFNYMVPLTAWRAGGGPALTNANTTCTIDKYGYVYTCIQDDNPVGKTLVGFSGAPLAQLGIPKLIDPSKIPTLNIGCFTSCNSFPTIKSGNN